MENVGSGLEHSEKNVYTEYVDRKRDEWSTKILLALKEVRLSQLVKGSGMSPSALKELRAGHSRPHRKNQALLVAILKKLGIMWANPPGRYQEQPCRLPDFRVARLTGRSLRVDTNSAQCDYRCFAAFLWSHSKSACNVS